MHLFLHHTEARRTQVWLFGAKTRISDDHKSKDATVQCAWLRTQAKRSSRGSFRSPNEKEKRYVRQRGPSGARSRESRSCSSIKPTDGLDRLDRPIDPRPRFRPRSSFVAHTHPSLLRTPPLPCFFPAPGLVRPTHVGAPPDPTRWRQDVLGFPQDARAGGGGRRRPPGRARERQRH